MDKGGPSHSHDHKSVNTCVPSSVSNVAVVFSTPFLVILVLYINSLERFLQLDG